MPYEEITDLFAPLTDSYLDLYIVFCPEFFRGERSSWESGHVCMFFMVLTDTIQAFLDELRAEYETLQKAG